MSHVLSHRLIPLQDLTLLWFSSLLLKKDPEKITSSEGVSLIKTIDNDHYKSR